MVKINPELQNIENLANLLKSAKLAVIASRPGMGKRDIAFAICSHLSDKMDIPFCFFSHKKEISYKGKQIPLVDIRQSFEILLEKAEEMAEKQNVRLFVFDYLQIIDPPRNTKGNILEAWKAMICSLKDFAERKNVTVLLISQLPSSVDKRDDPKPVLSDLEACGIDKEITDLVIFLKKSLYAEEIVMEIALN